MGVRRNLAGSRGAPLLSLLLTLLLTVLLSACGGGDDSVADPPISSPPTSSATETPERESPEHFIRRWAEAERKMENTGETTAYLAISRGCDACRQLAHKVHEYYADGGFVKWGGWRILSIKANSKERDAVTYAVRNRSLPTAYKTSDTSPTKHFAGGVTTELVQIERAGDSWNVRSKAELAS